MVREEIQNPTKKFFSNPQNFLLPKNEKIAKNVERKSFSLQKDLHVCKLDHKCLATSKNQKMVRQAKFSISQQHIGPLILGESQIHISSPESICFIHFAMRYPVIAKPNVYV